MNYAFHRIDLHVIKIFGDDDNTIIIETNTYVDLPHQTKILQTNNSLTSSMRFIQIDFNFYVQSIRLVSKRYFVVDQNDVRRISTKITKDLF